MVAMLIRRLWEARRRDAHHTAETGSYAFAIKHENLHDDSATYNYAAAYNNAESNFYDAEAN
jgi:hypothetical protein